MHVSMLRIWLMNAAGIKWLDGRDVIAIHKSFQRDYNCISDVNVTINPKHGLSCLIGHLQKALSPLQNLWVRL